MGIPTVADRVAQMVAKQFLEPELEKHFHPDSYGYRPGKSALDAVGMARKRCWKNDWVLDLDIKGFFDNIDHELMMRAVRAHTEEKWVLLYIERWLKAPIEMPNMGAFELEADAERFYSVLGNRLGEHGLEVAAATASEQQNNVVALCAKRVTFEEPRAAVPHAGGSVRGRSGNWSSCRDAL